MTGGRCGRAGNREARKIAKGDAAPTTRKGSADEEPPPEEEADDGAAIGAAIGSLFGQPVAGAIAGAAFDIFAMSPSHDRRLAAQRATYRRMWRWIPRNVGAQNTVPSHTERRLRRARNRRSALEAPRSGRSRRCWLPDRAHAAGRSAPAPRETHAVRDRDESERRPTPPVERRVCATWGGAPGRVRRCRAWIVRPC